MSSGTSNTESNCFPVASKTANSASFVPSLDVLLIQILVENPRGGGGGVLPYMGYIGMCRGIGYVFLGSRSLNRVSLLFLLALCSRCDP